MATNDAMAIVASPGFANAASSIVVAEGVWEACTHAYFRGRCVELLPGNYPHTDVDLNGRIASVRQVADTGRSTPIVITAQPVIVNPAPVVISAPQIVASPAPIVVNPASVVVNPAPVAGSAQPMVISSAPASINALPPIIVNVPPAVIAVPPVVTAAPSPTGRMVLYEYPNFGGARATIGRGQAKDLDWTNFAYGHRAMSIRVESGTWMLCSEMSFQGECRILGPGESAIVGTVGRRDLFGAAGMAYGIRRAEGLQSLSRPLTNVRRRGRRDTRAAVRGAR